MKYEVLDFIKRRFSNDEHWINGNCLWFAFILKKRFRKAKIYYLPIQGHFVTLIDGEYYDWKGIVKLKETPYALNWIKRTDKLLYKRLLRDCMEEYMNRVFIKGDCHGNFDFLTYFCQDNETDRKDVLVILGDAGINFYLNKRDYQLKEFINKHPITLLCIQGNHDCRPANLAGYSLIKMWDTLCWFEEEFPNILFPMDGPINLYGHKCLVLGGAYSVDKYYRLRNHWTWFPDEQMSTEEQHRILALLDNNNSFDYIFSHTAPLNYEPRYLFLPTIDQSEVDKTMENFLQEVYDKITFKRWFLGHYHADVILTSNLRIMYNDIIEL